MKRKERKEGMRGKCQQWTKRRITFLISSEERTLILCISPENHRRHFLSSTLSHTKLPSSSMEDQCSPFSWEFCFQEEGMEELRQALLYTTLELQTTIASAKEEITRRELEMVQINDLLTRTMKERDETQSRCKELQLEKLILQQQLSRNEQPKLPAAPLPRKTSSSDDEAMLVSSGVSNSPLPPSPPPALAVPKVASELAVQKPLPPKGKLLQAVMEAGPLLQTLLLAGPLPEWEHPPPPLDSTEIPPVAIPSPTSSAKFNGGFGNKRSSECSETSESPKNKHQKLILH